MERAMREKLSIWGIEAQFADRGYMIQQCSHLIFGTCCTSSPILIAFLALTIISNSPLQSRNKCPSRNYRRNVDLTERHANLADRHENFYDELRRRQTSTGGGVLNYTKLENGQFALSLFGNSSVGDSVYATDGSVTRVSEVNNQPWSAWQKFGMSFACFWWPFAPGC